MENKVKSFLSEVLSRTTDEKTGCEKPGMHIRDNEQVGHVFIYQTILIEHNKGHGISNVCNPMQSAFINFNSQHLLSFGL